MFSHKDAQQRRQRGFTLMEVVIVLAVIGALSAAIAPMAFSYLADAKKTQAQNDANQIAQAIGQFFKDTGRPPYKNTTATLKIAAKEAVGGTSSGDFDCLYGLNGNEWTTTTDATTSDTWTSSGGVQCQGGAAAPPRDTIENHLILNAPAGISGRAYTTSGISAWKGPYLPSVPSDPWGNKYLVNVGKADPSANKAVWVISGGPNGSLETNADAAVTGVITLGADDIIARVK